MKAAVYYQTGGPEVFRYEDMPDPVARRGGIVVEIKAVGIQGGDTLHRQGGVMATTPHIVGYQAAGVVCEVGEGVADRQVGQHVVCTMGFGSHAELASVPVRTSYVLPEEMPFEVGASIPIEFGTADDCLFEFGHLVAGETVLVQAGASGVGLAAIQLAKAAGAKTVIATASSDERLARLRDYGMDVGINYTREDLAARTFEATGGHGADLVVDSVGGKTLEASIAALAYRGRISWVGQAGREADVPQIWPIMQKNGSITGVFLGAEFSAQPDRTRAMIERLIGRVASGELKVAIDRTFPLSDAEGAHRYIEARKAFGRVLLIP
ncbi:MAG: zinc-binding alcohol dehydrogenase family protein [Dehalococcoidia bacterium]